MLDTGERARLLVSAPFETGGAACWWSSASWSSGNQAVLAVVQDGWKVTEVAARLGVSRQSVHAWIAR